MLIALWILNSLLGLAFLAAGAVKLARPREALAASAGMSWAEDFSSPAVKLIAALEVIGAVGLIVPLATGSATFLTPLAAVGLAVLMIGATVVHLRRSEPPMPAAALALLSAVSTVLGFLALA